MEIIIEMKICRRDERKGEEGNMMETLWKRGRWVKIVDFSWRKGRGGEGATRTLYIYNVLFFVT